MSRKTVSGILLTLLSIGMLPVIFNIQPVQSDWTWTETIYIRANGSIGPETAPISTFDNITYTLTDNVIGDVPAGTSAIVVERDNIVVDGAGYTVQGTGSGWGIELSRRTNVTVRNTQIKTFNLGIYLNGLSNHNIISANNITNNEYGILLAAYFWGGGGGVGSSSNTISDNNIANNGYGIDLHYASNYNTISGNNIANNGYGVKLRENFNNEFYHNNFINNTKQVYDLSWDNPSFSHSINVWDEGYPFGGNYWSDYNGTDLYSGLYQNETGRDGIGDTPYVIDENNQDNYPLMNPYVFYNTPVGTNATFTDPATGATVVFDEVTEAGDTTIVTSGTGPPPPSGFRLVPLAPPVYYEITTTATYTGMIEIAIPYDETEVRNENNLQLMHWDEETHRWVDVTKWIDDENNVIYGEISSLSVFAIMEYIGPVGGVWSPINKLKLLAPYIGLASLIAVATISIVYVKYRKKKQT